MNCRFLLINFFLTWHIHYNALIFKFNQLFGLYQYVCRACCNCKIIFLFIFYNLMGDLVNIFFICVILVSFSVGTYTPTLYTRWSWSPGRKLLLGLRQTIMWVISSIKIQCTEESYDYISGERVSRVNVIFGSKINHTCINRFICLKLWMQTVHVYIKVLQLSDFKFNFFHIWFVKYVPMNLLGLVKLSKLIPMSIYKKFQTA